MDLDTVGFCCGEASSVADLQQAAEACVTEAWRVMTYIVLFGSLQPLLV